MQANRRNFLKAGGALVVGFNWSATGSAADAARLAPAKQVAKTQVESFVAIHADGGVTVYVGKVDLGTGTRTALAQIAADELEVRFDRITMVMGDTGTTPDQWLTGANLTIAQGGAVGFEVQAQQGLGVARAHVEPPPVIAPTVAG